MKEKLIVQMLFINAITSGIIVGAGVFMYLMSGSVLKMVTVMSCMAAATALVMFANKNDTWFANAIPAVPAAFACSFYVSSAYGGINAVGMLALALVITAFAASSVEESDKLPFTTRYILTLPFFLGTVFGGLLLLDERRQRRRRISPLHMPPSW